MSSRLAVPLCCSKTPPPSNWQRASPLRGRDLRLVVICGLKPADYIGPGVHAEPGTSELFQRDFKRVRVAAARTWAFGKEFDLKDASLS
jgi:hypothetical protein